MTTPGSHRSEWFVIAGRTQRKSGAKKAGDQDALLVFADDPASSGVAVADGHGDKRHIRSSFGSSKACLAAAAAGEKLLTILGSSETSGERSAIGHYVADRLPEKIVQEWTDAARADYWRSPIREIELEALELDTERWCQKYGAPSENAVGNTNAPSGPSELPAAMLELYGSTLLGFAGTPGATAMWQIGDGAIVIVTADYEASILFPDQDDGGGEATDSLCNADAESLFRTQVWYEPSSQIRMILLCTDGLEKAFGSEADFLKRVVQLSRSVVANGHPRREEDRLQSELYNLADQAQKFSGDDTAIAIAVNVAHLER